jgi:hypothetical protein
MSDEHGIQSFKRLGRPNRGKGLNARTALLGLFVALTIVLASTTVYESGTRTTLTSTSTATSTATSVSTTTSTTTQTTTVTSTFDLAKALTDAYLSHIAAIESGNMTALAAQYEANATLYAPQDGNRGNYFDGVANITSFYGGELSNQCPPCFGVDFPFAGAANETYSITTSKDHNAGNVTSQLILYGIGGPYGQSTFTNGEKFGISYVLQGDRWLISGESLTQISGGYCQMVSLTPDGVLICTPSSG